MSEQGGVNNPTGKLSQDYLRRLKHQTPFLFMDLDAAEASYRHFSQLLPEAAIHYAMKCNPAAPILERLLGLGGKFEIASINELRLLKQTGANPGDVIFSNPVKIASHIKEAWESGLYRFCFDSQVELEKIAQNAPGASVYVRLKTTPAGSHVPSEGKYGVDSTQAAGLIRRAKRLGLKPYGIAFHVGSQMHEPLAWQAAITQSCALVRGLETEGIKLKMLDLGGGFPAHYQDDVPKLAEFTEVIKAALQNHLPYAVDLIIEPGRALVGDAGVMVASVIGLAERAGERWAHLDVGAFNGMMEALETQNQLLYPLADSRRSPQKARFNLTGPSCDSQDTILFDAELSKDLALGDLVYLHTAGAYTASYASEFNGFDLPKVYCA